MKVTIQGTEYEVVVKVINGRPYVILPYANLGNANLWNADLSTVRNLELALNLDKVWPNAPKSLPEGWAFDPAKGIYLKPTAPVTCQHIQTGKFCSECGKEYW